MEVRLFKIGRNDFGQRLDRFLTKEGFTIGVIRKALRHKDIKVCGRVVAADHKLELGDEVKVYYRAGDLVLVKDKEYTLSEGELSSLIPDLNIVYEDENIIILDKAVGVICHDGKDSLINRIKAYLYQRGEFSPRVEGYFEPSLCNRIDRNTGGIVIAAKNAPALREMNEAIKSRRVKKLYLCLLVNAPKEKAGVITGYLTKDSEHNMVSVSDELICGSKRIVTKYRILEEGNKIHLAEVDLLTGRTHQIRAHMAHIGCPLLGDGKYGLNKLNKPYGLDKQALYSYKVLFNFGEGDFLSYLDNREFKVSSVWFLERFGFNFKF